MVIPTKPDGGAQRQILVVSASPERSKLRGIIEERAAQGTDVVPSVKLLLSPGVIHPELKRRLTCDYLS